MAEVDTLMLAKEHSDIRREQAEQASNIRQQNADRIGEVRYDIGQGVNEVIKEGLKGDFETQKALNGVERANSNQIDAFEDVVNSQFFTVARESADNKAQITALGFQVRDGFYAAGKDAEINALKGVIEGQKNTQYLADRIGGEGEKTRALIENIRGDDLNRRLIERNALLIGEYEHTRHWRDRADQSQFAAVQSQMQNFGSQLQETRQGMVNFGTMTGTTQASSSNNV